MQNGLDYEITPVANSSDVSKLSDVILSSNNNFLINILMKKDFSKENINLSILEELNIRDFRNFFSSRAQKKISKTSIAREESAIKNFYKWLNNNKIINKASGTTD